MEGWIIWIIIIAGFAIFRAVSENKDKEKLQDFFIENKFEIRVKSEIPPKDTGLPQVKCFAVQAKGLCGHPTDDQVKFHLTIHDNTDHTDDEPGLPVCSAQQAWAENEGRSRVFGLSVIKDSSPDSYYPDFSHFTWIPKDFILPPNKGKRRLRFSLAACDVGASIQHSFYDNTETIKHYAYTFVDFNFKDIGYMDELVNKEKVEDLTIQLGMCMAAVDGHLDQKELNIIKDWAKKITDELESDKAAEKKKHFSNYIKKAYSEAKSKKASLSSIVNQLNDKAGKASKYMAIELMLDIAKADGKLSKTEVSLIDKIAKTTGIDLKTFQEMKNKVIANVDKIEMSEKPSEEGFGFTKDMEDKEKCKELRKQFTKWNNQTTHKDLKRRKRAKEMVKAIAELRKKYNC